jgi:hypothetical protein
VKVSLRFGGTYRLHLRNWRVNQASNQQKAGNKQLQAICVRRNCSSLQRPARRYILEEKSPHSHRYEDLKSKIVSCRLLLAGFFLGLHSDPEDGGSISSETSVDFYRITRNFIPKDRTIQVLKYSRRLAILASSLPFDNYLTNRNNYGCVSFISTTFVRTIFYNMQLSS